MKQQPKRHYLKDTMKKNQEKAYGKLWPEFSKNKKKSKKKELFLKEKNKNKKKNKKY